jgi:hypothetical protein
MKKLFIILILTFVLTIVAYAKWPRPGQPGYNEYIDCRAECYEKMKDCVDKQKRTKPSESCREKNFACMDSCEAKYEARYRK